MENIQIALLRPHSTFILYKTDTTAAGDKSYCLLANNDEVFEQLWQAVFFPGH